MENTGEWGNSDVSIGEGVSKCVRGANYKVTKSILLENRVEDFPEYTFKEMEREGFSIRKDGKIYLKRGTIIHFRNTEMGYSMFLVGCGKNARMTNSKTEFLEIVRKKEWKS